jgi:hypothetical protein
LPSNTPSAPKNADPDESQINDARVKMSRMDSDGRVIVEQTLLVDSDNSGDSSLDESQISDPRRQEMRRLSHDPAHDPEL